MVIEEVNRVSDTQWPNERTAFKGVIEYEVTPEDSEEPLKMYIDYDFKDEYDRRRRHITVYQKKSKPLARFVGADHWSVSGNVVWRMRQDEGRALIRDLKDKPEAYEGYEPVRFRRLVTGTGAPACWGIAVREHPVPLIEIALTRVS